ncbi:PH domain-containing protein [Streptomyces sp. JJ66]|uniref:PH domain-containing protein n=1 Tax=Streptomyces sp. JJ66 TaxID=2803843 RepID=UPI001C59C71E|nr:PH domain-containing protein [Streptomyces sp. JJ66]MBW1604255.1 PH domain-containing protein [Streptomyces sp. JJ66]
MPGARETRPEPGHAESRPEPATAAERAAEGHPEPGTRERVASAEGRRLHPVTPWRRTWAPIAAMAVFAAQDYQRTREWFEALTLGWLLLAFAVVVPVAAGYGFWSWWVTHYAVTDTELRIRTGIVFRRVAHLRLDRIQAVDVSRPLLARVLGVAKLKLDVVGTSAKDELAYLGEADAVALRAELLARAAGIAPEAAPQAGEAPERELLRVPPGMLTVALLLMGTGWGFLLALAVGPLALWWFTGSVTAALATGLPMAGGVWKSTVGRYLTEYDWKVAESPDGVRVDHGLLNREHATVPPGRVQSVRLREPLLWRRRGWVRVELAVAGGGEADTPTVLLPVAEWAVAARVVAQALPGVDVTEAVRAVRGVPRRARFAVPVWWRGYGHGVTDAVFVTRHGRLSRVHELVPHAKVQSVRLAQGPWERRLRLANVHVDHGANGHVTVRLRDADAAHALVAAQADRSRTGRHTARPERWLT